jgi:hypothetical protein
MKSTIAQYLVSSSLDNQKAPPKWAANDPAAREFAGDAQALHGKLRQQVELPAVPDDLHTRIMKAVEKSPITDEVPSRNRLALGKNIWKPAFAVAFGIVLVSAVLFILKEGDRPPSTAGAPPSPDQKTLHAASEALALGGELPATLSNVFTPLQEEQKKLDQDLQKVARHLLASVP